MTCLLVDEELGCEYFSECVHLLIGFLENFLDFSDDYSFFRAKSIYWKVLKIYLSNSKDFIWNPRDPNYLLSFSRNF
jgi:hypothetical protein